MRLREQQSFTSGTRNQKTPSDTHDRVQFASNRVDDLRRKPVSRLEALRTLANLSSSRGGSE